MAVTPSTEVKLLNVPIEIDNKNQLTFANAQSQYNYFNSLASSDYSYDDFSYQRKNSTIFVNEHIDNILHFNYVMYKNDNYSDKWFYCFITNMTYLNDNCTAIQIETDVFQTWQFDIIYNQSFVEREMINVSEDFPGANLIPEGLEAGEIKIESSANFNELSPVYVVAYGRDPYVDGLTPEQTTSQGTIANGVYNGCWFCYATLTYIQGVLATINAKGFGQSILTVFTIPAFALIGFNGWSLEDILSGVLYWQTSPFKAEPITKNLIATPSAIDGYTPKNQKLRTYPYLYLGFNPSNRVF